MIFKNLITKVAAFLVVSFSFIACDDDFSTVGGEIIENPADVEVEEFEVTAYSKKLNSVQTNNLPDHLLGVYNDPIYGQSEASILTQLSLSTNNPTFGQETRLDSVVLTIPYYSTEGDSDENDNIEYALDSIYGDGPFKLSIQESRYFLSNFDPDANFQDRQKYYSDQQDLFEENLVGDVIYENENFLPSSEAIVTYGENDEGEQDTITSGPALRIHLPVEYFQEKIIDKEGSAELSNNNNFTEYLRGLFIKAEAVNEEGSMILFDLEEGNINLHYTHEREAANDDGEDEIEEVAATYQLNFGDNVVNTFEGDFPVDVLQAITGADKENGEENLFLKGGEGSMAIVELFEDEAQLEELRENNWLINEANLIFYVNQEMMAGNTEPDRLYIYDVENNRVLADYSFAENRLGDLNPEDPFNSMATFSSPLERNEEGDGISYTLNLTQHLTGVLNYDGDNVKLGVVVTQNINETGSSAVRGDEQISRVPAMSLISPQGTVLHGNLSDDADKRLKLRIFYTQTEE